MDFLIYIAIFASHLLYACVWIDPLFYKKSIERYNYDPINVLANISIVLKFAQFYLLSLCLINYTIELDYFYLKILPILFGQLLNYKVYEKLGYRGVYYGFKFGYKIPWVTTFPYNILNNPQYVGCQLTLVSIMMFYPYYEICKICCFWILLYINTACIEKTKYILQDKQIKIVPVAEERRNSF